MSVVAPMLDHTGYWLAKWESLTASAIFIKDNLRDPPELLHHTGVHWASAGSSVQSFLPAQVSVSSAKQGIP